jgi:hypothetical protein
VVEEKAEGETMTKQDKKYDVAISFLHRDEPLADEIHQRLAEHFNVFVYQKRQEELAGTNGLESFREAFRVESRLVVVLYREGWGKTTFTRVEEDAITDRFRDDGWDFLLFVMLNDTDEPPKWLPEKRIRFSYLQYGLQQLLGAVKMRAQELGSVVRTETTVDRAKRFAAESQSRADREGLLQTEGSAALVRDWRSFIEVLSERSAEANTHLPFNIEPLLQRSSDEFFVHARNVSLRLSLCSKWPPEESYIRMEEFTGRVGGDNDFGRLPNPQRVAERKFCFDYQTAFGWCWRLNSSTDFYTASSLADELLKTLLNLQDRFEKAEIKSSDNRPRHYQQFKR